MAISVFEGADAAHRKNSFEQSLVAPEQAAFPQVLPSGDEPLTEN